MHTLVDGDICCYRCAAVTENDDVSIAKYQLDEFITRVLKETNAYDHTIYLSGPSNFRYDIYPEYKANRKDLPRPKHLEACKEHLVTTWGAKVTDGIEADDAMGIHQYGSVDTCIASIDKDLLMIPGFHYNFVKQEFRTVSFIEGLRNFYFQLIMGDRSDNIPGYDGKMRTTVPKFLQEDIDHLMALDSEQDMYHLVYNMYCRHAAWGDDPEAIILRNGQCLWIQRKEGDLWKIPNEKKEEDTQL